MALKVINWFELLSLVGPKLLVLLLLLLQKVVGPASLSYFSWTFFCWEEDFYNLNSHYRKKITKRI